MAANYLSLLPGKVEAFLEVPNRISPWPELCHMTSEKEAGNVNIYLFWPQQLKQQGVETGVWVIYRFILGTHV